jgi:hypothetical protein
LSRGTNVVAFFTGDLEGQPPQDYPRPIVVLQVIPKRFGAVVRAKRQR